jgi:hypothetical protein
MLNTARTAFYSMAWNTGGGNLQALATTTVNAIADTINNLFVRPSRYADFSPVTTVGSFGPGSNFTGSGAIDMTDIGTNSRQQLDAITFRPGTNWLAGVEEFTPGGGQTNSYNNNGTPEQRGPNWWSNGDDPEFGGIVFSSGGAGTGIRFPGDQFDQYRNRWLTFIAASSDDSADFANWSGGPANEYNWAFRLVLIDVGSAQIIGQADGWSFRAAGTIDLTQTWYFNTGGSYTFSSSLNLSVDSASAYDIAFASSQSYIGSTADPADPAVYLDLLGTGFNTELNGDTPISGWTFDSAGTALTGTYGTYGYSTAVVPWTRLPTSGVAFRIQADANLDPAEAPVFTSF